MTKEIKVDTNKLRQKVEFLDSIGLKSWSDYEAYARCLSYFDENEKAAEYFIEAAKLIEKPMAVFEKKNQKEYTRLKLVQANYYRLAGEKELSLQQYGELSNLLEDLFHYVGDKEQSEGLLTNLSYCHFFLQDYEKSIYFGKRVKEWVPISLGFSQGILYDDQARIEAAMDDVIEDIKREKSLHYYTGAEVSLWDWYEIGKELLK
ncbi:hypothetical protein [Metabacillus bambusae]|uniref:Tetratricopeptide repeat protein n=1 Tax=Metabacillus bambusae TaxID=2795218 RepID=A0ABS3MYL4_9BACI|nr:hypothetical protein [Metabacillus bambusae]MBO1511033.1 hypothetical protein [Metabacillus bambusae]